MMKMAARRQAAQAAAQEAEYQRQEALANRDRAAADAVLSERVGEAEGVEARLEGESFAAGRLVSQAARGGRIDVGTNFLIRLQDAARTEWEVFKTNLGSTQRTNRFVAESKAFQREANQWVKRKRNISRAETLGYATDILGGVGQGAMMGGGGFSSTSTGAGSAASTFG